VTIVRVKSLVPALLALMAVVLAAPLLAHAYAGTFSRYMGDDYCAGSSFNREGIIGAQKYFYDTWGAVPTTILLMAVTDLFGPAHAGWWPALALLLWIATMVWAIVPIARRIYPEAPLALALALCLAEAIAAVTIADAPNAIQSIYLRVPMLAYLGPIIGLSFFIGFLVRAANTDRAVTPKWLIASGAIAFIVGNFGPVCVAMQTTALGIALAVVWTMGSERTRRRLLPVLAAGVAGSVAGLALVAVAPGNALRARFFPPRPGLIYIARSSVLDAVFMFVRPVLSIFRPAIEWLVPIVLPEARRWLTVALGMGSSPFVPILVAGIGALLGLVAPAAVAAKVVHRTLLLIALPIIAFVLVTSCMAVGVYGTSAPPPPRALIIPQFACEILLLLWGAVAGVAARSGLASRSIDASSRLVTPLLLIVIVIGTGKSAQTTARTLSLASSLRSWTTTWDQGDRELREAARTGRLDATAPSLPPVGGVGSIARDPNDWVNACAAQYYGLTSVTGR
jgi:hypothetical protein